MPITSCRNPLILLLLCAFLAGCATTPGTPPPSGDAIYKDLEAYFHWLATGAPNGVELPGAGYPVPEMPEAGYDRTRGAEVFGDAFGKGIAGLWCGGRAGIRVLRQGGVVSRCPAC